MPPQAKNISVALVLDPVYGEGITSLCKVVPVWIIDSAENLAVVEAIRDKSGSGGPVTTFSGRLGESPAMVCQRIIQSLDQHHDESSQDPAYNELVVLGVSLRDVSLRPFMDVGFSEFLQTSDGFIARKRLIRAASESLARKDGKSTNQRGRGNS